MQELEDGPVCSSREKLHFQGFHEVWSCFALNQTRKLDKIHGIMHDYVCVFISLFALCWYFFYLYFSFSFLSSNITSGVFKTLSNIFDGVFSEKNSGGIKK